MFLSVDKNHAWYLVSCVAYSFSSGEKGGEYKRILVILETLSIDIRYFLRDINNSYWSYGGM